MTCLKKTDEVALPIKNKCSAWTLCGEFGNCSTSIMGLTIFPFEGKNKCHCSLSHVLWDRNLLYKTISHWRD